MATKLFKRVVIFLSVAALLAIGSVTIYAHSIGDNNWEVGKHLPFSPDMWNRSVYWDDGSQSFVSASTNLSWGQAAADAVKTSGHRYTHDVSDVEPDYAHHLEATNWFSTNFWDPKFDLDMEHEVYGRICEAEVTAQNQYFPPASQTPGSQVSYVYFKMEACELRDWLYGIHRAALRLVGVDGRMEYRALC